MSRKHVDEEHLNITGRHRHSQPPGVAVEDDVIVGGLSGVHQWVRIGRGAIIGAVTMVTNDVIPYGLVQAPRGHLDGLNLVGLKRRGVARSDITALRAAFQMLAQGEGTFQDRARRLGHRRPHARASQIRHVRARQ